MKKNILSGIGLGAAAGMINAWKDPVSRVPIIIMITILGGALGYLIHRIKG